MKCEIKNIKKTDDGEVLNIEVRDEYEGLQAYIKWDGCINLYRYFNGASPDSLHNKDSDVDYIHICEVKEFIDFLQGIVDITKDNFSESNFSNYWE